MTDHATGVLRVHNTLTNRVEPVVPADPARVTFYTCGPTVYDDAHIGNFRSFLAADLLRRWIESPLCTLATDNGGTHAGPREVVHVMNITDVGHMTDDDVADGAGEDKMAVAGKRLAEAKKAGKLPAGVDVNPNDPRAIAAFYADRFLDDARKLGLKVAIDAGRDPTLMPRATDHIARMIADVEHLVERGHAYVRGDPGQRAVYFDVQRFARYGELSGNTLDNLRGGAGGRVSDDHQAAKNHPADFLLWKEDPRHLMRWPSPWGEGHPGWHIECSAMSLERLDPTDARQEIDIHSGGEDNIFPHHECENAQACAATGHARFARTWFHPRFLMVEGKKMSKSAGTFYTARQLFEQGHEPAAVRLALIGAHYRKNLDFSANLLDDCAKRLDRWRYHAASMQAIINSGAGDTFPDPDDRPGNLLRRFSIALSSDLNASAAISAVDTACYHRSTADLEEVLPNEPWPAAEALARYEQATPGTPHAALAALHLVDNVLGVIFRPLPKRIEFAIGVFLPGAEPSAEVESLLADRVSAKQAKDFARADAIRDELRAKGYAIKDVAGGRVEVGPA